MFAAKLLLAVAAAKAAVGAQLAMYWGQQDDGNERSLGAYCKEGAADIMILAFLNSFGGGAYPSGSFGDCSVNSDQSFSGCSSLAADIATCHSNGKKVFLSVGGADGHFALTSKGDATGVAYSLWNSYAHPSVTSNSPRPFGNSYVDGWDFDIESNPNGQSQSHLGDLVTGLRAYFSKDTSRTYYISGAPQCPLPEDNMGNSMMSAKYDYLFIQFYNNNCAASDLFRDSNSNPDGAGSFNMADWPGYLSKGASAKAKLHVGLPGNKAEAGDYFYVPTTKLAQVANAAKSVAGYNGFMIYDAGDSDVVSVNNCNYAQNVKSVINKGAPC